MDLIYIYGASTLLPLFSGYQLQRNLRIREFLPFTNGEYLTLVTIISLIPLLNTLLSFVVIFLFFMED